MARSIYIINSRGERELFSFRKVYRSARRVGASKELAKEIAKTIEKEVLPETRTSEIFKKVKKLLRKELPGAALRFNLKEGMRKLGPTGFLFEKYAGEILSKQGFSVKFNQYIPGFCSTYEIDFLAQRDGLAILGECKYHNLAGKRVDLGVALGNYARFLDIKKGGLNNKNSFGGLRLKSLVVTNTKFTSKATKYSQCVGVGLLGWKYPKKRGLEHLIDNQGLYPITILPSFKRDLTDIFISKRMMLAKDILKIDIKEFAKKNKIPVKRLEPLLQEAKTLFREN